MDFLIRTGRGVCVGVFACMDTRIGQAHMYVCKCMQTDKTNNPTGKMVKG